MRAVIIGCFTASSLTTKFVSELRTSLAFRLLVLLVIDLTDGTNRNDSQRVGHPLLAGIDISSWTTV